MRQLDYNIFATGLQKAIEDLRKQMKESLSWLTYSFPIAEKITKVESKKTIVSPNVRQYKANGGTYDDIEVVPKERTNFCFFVLLTSERSTEVGSQANLGLIFFVDFSTINLTADFSSVIKAQVKGILDNPSYRDFNVVVDSMLDSSFKDVWKEFTMLDTQQQYARQPYYTFRVNLTIFSQDVCIVPTIPPVQNC